MSAMQLKLQTPTGVLLDVPAVKVVAEAQDGLFCLLPRHVDFVCALVPGILYCTTAAGQDRLVAVDEGALVKCGAEVLVSTTNAVLGTDLTALQAMVAETFLQLDDDERRARSALARLESGAMRWLLALERQSHG
jgi:F-type H+-transporting ATPase subunit epsilon